MSSESAELGKLRLHIRPSLRCKPDKQQLSVVGLLAGRVGRSIPARPGSNIDDSASYSSANCIPFVGNEKAAPGTVGNEKASSGVVGNEKANSPGTVGNENATAPGTVGNENTTAPGTVGNENATAPLLFVGKEKAKLPPLGGNEKATF
jgi:hypothetical protein